VLILPVKGRILRTQEGGVRSKLSKILWTYFMDGPLALDGKSLLHLDFEEFPLIIFIIQHDYSKHTITLKR
jgi:hypothetical protein